MLSLSTIYLHNISKINISSSNGSYGCNKSIKTLDENGAEFEIKIICNSDVKIDNNYNKQPFTSHKLLKIVTSFVHPPISDRKSDWCAYEEGCEEDGNYGHGATEREAINNFLDILEEGERL